MQRPVEDHEIELRRLERQRVEIRLHGDERHGIVPARTEPIRLVVEPIDGDHAVTEGREAMRQPAAARPEIERVNRSVPGGRQCLALKVDVALLPHAPLAGARVVATHVREHPVVLGRRRPVSVARPDRTVLPLKRLGRFSAPGRQKTVHAATLFEAGAAAAARKVRDRDRGATLRTRESRQPHTHHAFLRTIRK